MVLPLVVLPLAVLVPPRLTVVVVVVPLRVTRALRPGVRVTVILV